MNSDLYNDPLLARFYDSASQADRLDFAYCVGLAQQGQTVLDLGCGTGELAGLLSQKCIVTGVEPAGAMLEIARERVGCENVTWVEADARDVRLGERFDLVLLTGHSFQVFLNREDQLALLNTIALHLKPSGRFIFDSRNLRFVAPKARAEGTNVQTVAHPEHGDIEMWNVSDYDEAAGILTYKNGFRIVATGESHSAEAQILYTEQALIAEMIEQVGLRVETWYGDWLGIEFANDTKEVIPFGRLA